MSPHRAYSRSSDGNAATPLANRREILRLCFIKRFDMYGGPNLSFLTPKRRCRSFAIRKCDLNGLDGTISTFSDGFLLNFQGCVQFYLKKLWDWVLFKSDLLQDRVSFSGFRIRDRVIFQIFQQHLPARRPSILLFADQVSPPPRGVRVRCLHFELLIYSIASK